MKSEIKVVVEVTPEVTTTKSGKAKQVVYVDLGNQYPERDEMWQPDSGPVKPGKYFATKMRKSRFDIVLDYNHLTPVPAATAARAS